jgi:exopolysaccharide production protein ExoZ
MKLTAFFGYGARRRRRRPQVNAWILFFILHEALGVAPVSELTRYQDLTQIARIVSFSTLFLCEVLLIPKINLTFDLINSATGSIYCVSQRNVRQMCRPAPLRSIQILRAVAAILVVIGHAFHDSSYIAQYTERPAIDLPFFEWGFGIDIFFVVSGFIMTYTTADTFGCPGAAPTFLKRRFIRIAPMYWLMTTGLIGVAIVAPSFLNVPIENLRSIITSYLFIPDIRGNGEVRPILATGWTLNYEMFFYAIFACCLTLPRRRGVLWLCGFFVALSAIGGIARLPGVVLPFWANSIVLEFVLGVLIGLASRARFTLSARGGWLLTAVAIVLAVSLGPLWGWNHALPQFVCGGIPAALLVLAAALAPSLSPGRVVTFLVTLGDASYSLYLTHPFVVRPLRNVWIGLDGGRLPLGLYVTVCVAVAVAASVVIFQLIEKPLTSWFQQRLRHHAQRQFISTPTAAAVPLSTP